MPGISLYSQFGRDSAIVLGAAILFSAIMPLLPFLAYPINLFFTMIHELGHVFMTMFTGGISKGFKIFPTGEGVAESKGGDSLLILPAGYLGTPLFSAGLIMLTNLPYLTPYVLGVMEGLLVLFTMYSKPSFLTIFIGLTFGIGMIGTAWVAPLAWSVFVLSLLAIQGVTISLGDLHDLANQVKSDAPDKDDDATKMAEKAGCSAIFWVRVWTLSSIVIMAAAIWLAWIRNLLLLLNSA